MSNRQHANGLRHNEHPIDVSFATWIANYPESFHPLDLERFYRFVKTVCVYGRKRRGAVWLRQKLESTNHSLDSDDIDSYCELFETLQVFYRVPHLPVYRAADI